MLGKKMSWTEGAKGGDFTANLEIDGDKVAYVEMIAEPVVHNFGKKKVKRQGEEVEIDDLRYHVQIKFAGGTAEAKEKDPDSKEWSYFPPVAGEEYTLWLGATLMRGILKGVGWTSGDPDPTIKDTKWKIYRSKERRGGHRLYSSEKLDSFPTTFSGMDVAKDELVVVNVEKSAEVETPETIASDDQLTKDARTYATILKPLGELDMAAWETYCKRQGYEGEEFQKLLAVMTLEGLVKVDEAQGKVIYTGEQDV